MPRLFNSVCRIGVALMALVGSAGLARAVPITYSLSGVTFDSGATASGSFSFDADTGTACSTGSAPCGTYSNVAITISGGSFNGVSFTAICGVTVPSCTGVTPSSTQVLFLTSNASNQVSLPGLALFFTAFGNLPPKGLSDSGGTFDISNSSVTSGVGDLSACGDAACSFPISPSTTTAGTVTGRSTRVPEPATATLLASSLAAAAGLLGRPRRRTA